MLSRRQLNTAALGMALATVQRARAQIDTPTAAVPAQRNYPFSLGVASGLPRPDSVLLWTRLGGDFLEICEQCQRHMVIVRYILYSYLFDM
jgi:alkaline phosphatase D